MRKKLCPSGGLETAAQSEVGQRIAATDTKTAAESRIHTQEEIYEFLKPQFAKWWLPDDIVFMEEIPKTSVGKFLKQALRKKLEHLHREK